MASPTSPSLLSSNLPAEETSVLIVGLGPTGTLLSSLLGSFSIPNIALEKTTHITEDPRGIALDEDGIRALQAVGIYERIYTEIGSCFGMAKFIKGRNDLHIQDFMRINMATTEGGTGHVGGIGHRQPIMEKYLREAATKHPCSTLRPGCTVTCIEEDKDWVYCEYLDGADGRTRMVKARFLVGADGKTGFTRKMYLEPRGIRMERCSNFHYEEVWVALNWIVTPPTRETHPDFPLWKQGYEPEDIYDLFFPKDFRFVCDAERPAVCGRFGNGKERYYRFEFVVKKHEDPDFMASDEKTWEIIVPYLTHDGKKYGLDIPKIQFPVDCIEVLRSKPFKFSARSCNKWAMGRVILAGDAAHVFPPFGGQGIASGFRDALGLAWRLAIACREQTKNYEQLLSGWYRERKQQLDRSLATTVNNGRLCTEGNTWRFAFLVIVLRILQLVPSWKHWLEMGPRGSGMTRYQWQEGLPFLGNKYGGISLPQVYCAPIAHSSSKSEIQVSFTDDIIFRPGKQGLFQIVVLLDSLAQLEDARASLAHVDKLCGCYVRAEEATFIVQTSEVPLNEVAKMLGKGVGGEGEGVAGVEAGPGGEQVFRLATGAEFASCGPLCIGRPPPLYYDMHRMKRDVHGQRYAIVRPDRFLYAACQTGDDVARICEGIEQTLGLRSGGEQ